VRVKQDRAEQAGAQRSKNDGGAGTDVPPLGGTVAQRLGIKILELSAERVVGTMPVPDGPGYPSPALAGASCMLAETLAWFGASAHGGPERSATGIEISATHHRDAGDEDLIGVATRVHGGGTLARYDVEITGSRGVRVCTARVTCLLRVSG
jgi:uncharacterized protein (TIGR00369 family)